MPSPSIDIGLKGGLITGGLGRPACQGLIINAPFQLACFVFIPPDPEGVTGGAIPLAPGEIHDLYQPVTDFGYDFINPETVRPEVFGKKHVRIKVTSELFKGEKEFLVNIEKARIIVKALNFINATQKNIKIGINRIKVIATKAKVMLKKFKWKIRND